MAKVSGKLLLLLLASQMMCACSFSASYHGIHVDSTPRKVPDVIHN